MSHGPWWAYALGLGFLGVMLGGAWAMVRAQPEWQFIRVRAE